MAAGLFVNWNVMERHLAVGVHLTGSRKQSVLLRREFQQEFIGAYRETLMDNKAVDVWTKEEEQLIFWITFLFFLTCGVCKSGFHLF